MNEISEKKAKKVFKEWYELLKESGTSSVIYLPFINHFSVTGEVSGQFICIGLLLAQICNVTGKNVKEVLDKDFYEKLFPLCMKFFKEYKN